MSILKEMGIQQWRLRKSSHPLNDVEIGEPVIATSATAPEPSIDEPLSTVTLPNSTVEPIASEAVKEPQSAPAVDNPPLINAVPPVLAPAPLAEPSSVSTVVDPVAELDWLGLQTLIDAGVHCPSCSSTKSLLGAGNANADWMIVSDAPVSADLMSQQLFSGRAGQLFESMLMALDLTRDMIYTTSVFKCVASGDLSVTPNCDKILQRQIELVQPKVVLVFGEFAAQSVAKANGDLESMRAQNLMCIQSKVPIVATYAPVQILDEPMLKAQVWLDLKKARALSKA